MAETWELEDPRAMVASARVPIAVVAAAGLILALAPQMQDLLAALGDEVRPAWMFIAAAAAWGFSSWYWARTALVALHGDAAREAPGAGGWMFRWLPRLVLTVAFAVTAVLVLANRSDQKPFVLYAGAFLAVWGVLLAGTIFRTRLFGQRSARLHPLPPAPFAPWVGSLPDRIYVLLKAAPGGPVAAALFLASALALAVWAACDLAGFAKAFPGAATALIGLAAIVPVATVLVALLDQWDIPVLHRFPTIIAVLVWSTLVDTPFAERHLVRAALDSPRAAEDRLTLAEAVEAWLDRCAAGEREPKVVIVAAAGGASRAALWTTTVLAELEQRAGLHRHLFAISAVSGGALGAAVHLAAREEAGLGCDAATVPEGLASRAERAIGADFLGPTLAAYLFQDTWQLLSGWAQVLAALARGRQADDFLLPDRAAALEDAFARAWDEGATRPGLFGRGFLGAWYGKGWFDPSLPLLFQNGADVASGNRIITAPVAFLPRLASPWAKPLPAFAAATDHLGFTGRDVSLATSVTNSARFPYVTPAGAMVGLPAPNPEPERRQIVDGGYLDNHGARTAIEIADAVIAAAAARGLRATPVIVAITPHGERGLPPDEVARCANRGAPPPPPPPSERASELVAPLIGLAGSRAGHNALAIEALRARFCPSAADNDRQRFFHFYLPARCEARAEGVVCEDVPLNWVLSRRMRKHILEQMRHDPWNRAEADRLAALLGR